MCAAPYGLQPILCTMYREARVVAAVRAEEWRDVEHKISLRFILCDLERGLDTWENVLGRSFGARPCWKNVFLIVNTRTINRRRRPIEIRLGTVSPCIGVTLYGFGLVDVFFFLYVTFFYSFKQLPKKRVFQKRITYRMRSLFPKAFGKKNLHVVHNYCWTYIDFSFRLNIKKMVAGPSREKLLADSIDYDLRMWISECTYIPKITKLSNKSYRRIQFVHLMSCVFLYFDVIWFFFFKHLLIF